MLSTNAPLESKTLIPQVRYIDAALIVYGNVECGRVELARALPDAAELVDEFAVRGEFIDRVVVVIQNE